MVYKKGPLCFPGSIFGLKSSELLQACLIKLLPENLGALSVCLSPPAAVTVLKDNTSDSAEIFLMAEKF
jgi:hypothetical protein